MQARRLQASRRAHAAVTAGLAWTAAALPSAALAQSTGPRDGLAVGAWVFEPSLDVRLRAEYRRAPIDTGGLVYEKTAVFADDAGSQAPVVTGTLPSVRDQAFVSERTRLGLGVRRGPASAVVTLEDARALGAEATFASAPSSPALPRLVPLDAYLEMARRRGARAFFRVGRQRVTWGDGRLLSENDWGLAGRALDAARVFVQLGDCDVDLLASMLTPPGGLPPNVTGPQGSPTSGPGAQLYGGRLAWHLAPLIHAEATLLVRAVREPTPASLTPGDTGVGSMRVFGDERGFVYALEGAYELGRVAAVDRTDSIGAFAVAGRASLETKLPWHMTFGAHGSFASGDGDPNDGERTRFDPLLPDEHEHYGPMGMVGWSNSIDLGANIALRPGERTLVAFGYRNLSLASAADRWSTSQLVPVAAAPGNTSASLGNELDVTLSTTPWDALRFEAGYGLFAFGSGAAAALEVAKRKTEAISHWAYVSARLVAP